MSAAAPWVVASQSPLEWPSAGALALQAEQLLWTVPGNSPVLVGSVYVRVVGAYTNGLEDAWVLRLVDKSGAPLAAIPTSSVKIPLDAGVAGELDVAELTWVRGSAGSNGFVEIETNTLGGGLAGIQVQALGLPEIALVPMSTITLQRLALGATDAVTVEPIIVTYEPADAASLIAGIPDVLNPVLVRTGGG